MSSNGNMVGIPAPTNRQYTDYIKVHSDRALVVGDIEIPSHSQEMLEAVCAVAKKHQIDTVILNGDLVALDSFSTWAKDVADRLLLNDEIDPTIQVLRVFQRVFSNVYAVTGNHERRLARRLDGKLTCGKLLSDLTGVEFSEYSYCVLFSGGKEVLVCHPKVYSKRPLITPLELAAIHHTNVIAGHSHHLSFGFDRSGKYWIMDGGCCRDAERTEYKSKDLTTHPKWNMGFVVVLNGFPYLVTKGNLSHWL